MHTGVIREMQVGFRVEHVWPTDIPLFLCTQQMTLHRNNEVGVGSEP